MVRCSTRGEYWSDGRTRGGEFLNIKYLHEAIHGPPIVFVSGVPSEAVCRVVPQPFVPRARYLPKRGRAFSSRAVAFYFDSVQLTSRFFVLPVHQPANKLLSISCPEGINCALIVGTMARNSAKAAAERIEASTTSTSASSMLLSNSNAGSTFGTPITSCEDEEEPNFQRKTPARVMRATGVRRKRSAESDDGNPSISTKPATKKRAVMKAVYVEIPVPSANVSVGIALTPMGLD